eukprot:CAMPEP_0179243044 /NCGR_PEP_ID=MMETSP0797-20121207/17332_1 /TAXON_ID=47934 /ORGANISM="Dinophysis acuminata, Strain DAEP01" /LENGTH=82 /DNA_ID=CAMNT_0020950503 /DNA_START=44 /DNA_END=292 /DNA_ORIENTATION=-
MSPSLPPDEAMQWAPARQPLHIHAVGDQAAHGLPLVELVLREPGEAEVFGSKNLLAACELELGAAQCFTCNVELLILGADRN